MFPSHIARLISLQPEQLLACLAPFRHVHRYVVAYSGGVDSHVLLHLMAQMAKLEQGGDPLPKIEAIHINHQLQPDSDQWAEHCLQQAAMLGIALTVYCVDVDGNKRESVEERARKARYRCFEQQLQARDLLLMAHHLDDQVETVFLRLLRGAGSRGMAAIPHYRQVGCAELFRPLLDIPRSAIEHYAKQQGLQWVDDPSNKNSDIDRNFLRLQLLPLLHQRWPQYRQTIARSALFSEESDRLNTELAELDFHSLGLSPISKSLPLPALDMLSVTRKKNLLRYWLASRALPLPSAAQLQVVLDEVVGAKQDADPVVQWAADKGDDTVQCSVVQIRRFRDELYAIERLPDFDGSAVYTWDVDRPLAIVGAGQLLATSQRGAGLNARENITVRFRTGKERCRPSTRAKSQTLKKLLQEYDVPTWLRDRVPLLYVGDTLAAVGDLWICDGFTASGDQFGLVLRWDRP